MTEDSTNILNNSFLLEVESRWLIIINILFLTPTLHSSSKIHFSSKERKLFWQAISLVPCTKFSIPFLMEELFRSMSDIRISDMDVDPPTILRQRSDFQFLLQHIDSDSQWGSESFVLVIDSFRFWFFYWFDWVWCGESDSVVRWRICNYFISFFLFFSFVFVKFPFLFCTFVRLLVRKASINFDIVV